MPLFIAILIQTLNFRRVIHHVNAGIRFGFQCLLCGARYGVRCSFRYGIRCELADRISAFANNNGIYDSNLIFYF